MDKFKKRHLSPLNRTTLKIRRLNDNQKYCIITNYDYGMLIEYLSENLEKTGEYHFVDKSFQSCEPEYNSCCFCGSACNIASQACGRCVRNGFYL